MKRTYLALLPGLLTSVLICTLVFPNNGYILDAGSVFLIVLQWTLFSFIAIAIAFFAGSGICNGRGRRILRFILYCTAVGFIFVLSNLDKEKPFSWSFENGTSLLAPIVMVVLIVLLEVKLHFRTRNIPSDLFSGLARVLVYVVIALLFIDTPNQIERLLTPINWQGDIDIEVLYFDAFLIAMFFFFTGIARLSRGGKKDGTSGRFFCWNCGFIIHKPDAQCCSECGTAFPSNDTGEYTRPLIGKVSLRLGLLGILTPSGLLLGGVLFYIGELALLEQNHPGSLRQVLRPLLTNVGFAWIFNILLAVWIMLAAIRFARKRGRPRYAQSLFFPTIALLDASFAFFFAAHWVGIACLILAGLTIALQAFLPLERVDLSTMKRTEQVT